MSNKNMAFGSRMKEYEAVSKNYLTRRVPVIIRIDGRAFHTFTKGMNKPFDSILTKTMQKTMVALCQNVQGCVFGYTQSDEITLVLTDYENIDTSAWFDYNVQKVCSVVSSMATVYFNRFFNEAVDQAKDAVIQQDLQLSIEYQKYLDLMDSKKMQATFDARCFNIPVDEVCNCLIWRQQDATRNSIQSVGQSKFSHKQLNHKSCNEIQDMLFKEYGINWNNLPTHLKRGSACYKVQAKTINRQTKEEAWRNYWQLDTEIPIFTQERVFVEQWL